MDVTAIVSGVLREVICSTPRLTLDWIDSPMDYVSRRSMLGMQFGCPPAAAVPSVEGARHRTRAIRPFNDPSTRRPRLHLVV